MVCNVDTIGGGKVPCYFAGRPYSRCSSQNPDDGHCDPLSACLRMCSLVTAMLIRSSSSWWIISSVSLIFCVYLEDIVIISKSHAEHLRSSTNFFLSHSTVFCTNCTWPAFRSTQSSAYFPSSRWSFWATKSLQVAWRCMVQKCLPPSSFQQLQRFLMLLNSDRVFFEG